MSSELNHSTCMMQVMLAHFRVMKIMDDSLTVNRHFYKNAGLRLSYNKENDDTMVNDVCIQSEY